MFERFTERARRVVVLAQSEARLLNHQHIGTEHILLGLIAEGEGVAAKVLESMEISLDEVRRQLMEIIGAGVSPPTGHIPFTPRAKKVLELSLREALRLGHDYIGTEHILLGLIAEDEGVGAQVLQKLGANLSPTRQRVLEILGVFQRLDDTPVRFVGGRFLGKFSPAGREVVERAEKSALDLGDDAVEPADLLLALITADDEDVAALLASWGVDLVAVLHRIKELAAEEEPGGEPEAPTDEGGPGDRK